MHAHHSAAGEITTRGARNQVTACSKGSARLRSCALQSASCTHTCRADDSGKGAKVAITTTTGGLTTAAHNRAQERKVSSSEHPTTNK